MPFTSIYFLNKAIFVPNINKKLISLFIIRNKIKKVMRICMGAYDISALLINESLR